MVPTIYFNLTFLDWIIEFAVFTTTSLTNRNSLTSPTSGIIISGTTLYDGYFLFTLIAASITALVCISAISEYVTLKRHPLCPIIGLNSCNELMI